MIEGVFSIGLSDFFKKRLKDPYPLTGEVENFQPSAMNGFDFGAYQAENASVIYKFLETFDLTTIEGIQAISIPDMEEWEKKSAGVPSQPEQILLKTAAQYKHDEKMDLAIECLRKVNSILPYMKTQYQADTYMRLVEYLKSARRFDEARTEEEKLKRIHPDLFFIVQNPKLLDTIQKAHQYKCDHLLISTSSICPQCSPYKLRIYCISGSDQRFPHLSSLPSFMFYDKCDLCGCLIDYSVCFLNTMNDAEVWERSQYSQSPITDLRSDSQKQAFIQQQYDATRKRIVRKEYDWLWENLPDICPKSLNGYSRMKRMNSEKYQVLKAEAAKNGFELADSFIADKIHTIPG